MSNESLWYTIGDMHRSIILSVVGLTYFVTAGFGLYIADAGVIATAFFLFMTPAVLLAHYSYAPAPVIVSVVTLGLGIALLLEGTAHVYGLWYTLGADAGRLLNLVPVEAVIMIVSQVVFLALLYEQLFDDGMYTTSSARTRFAALVVFMFGTLGIVGIYYFFARLVWFEYSYIWLLGAIVGSAIATLGVYRVYTVTFFDRLVHFTFIGSIPLIVSTILAVTNTHKVFANTPQYIDTILIAGTAVPIEEILLSFTLAFFVATMYELYLDDQT